MGGEVGVAAVGAGNGVGVGVGDAAGAGVTPVPGVAARVVSVRRTEACARRDPRLLAVIVSVVATLPALRTWAKRPGDSRNRSVAVLPGATPNSLRAMLLRARRAASPRSTACTRHRGPLRAQTIRVCGTAKAPVVLTCAVAT